MSVALVFRATDAAANAVNSNSMNWTITSAGDPVAIAIVAATQAWWDFEQNGAGTQFTDSKNSNHLTSLKNGIVAGSDTATNSTATGQVGRGMKNANIEQNYTCYIPRSNTNLDLTNTDWSFGGWFRLPNSVAASTRFLIGRVGDNVPSTLKAYLSQTDTGAFRFNASVDGTTVVQTADVAVSTTLFNFVICTFDRTNNLIRMRVGTSAGAAMGNVTQNFPGTLYATVNTANFCVFDAFAEDANYFPGDRCPVNASADSCFFMTKALSDAECVMLYNAGVGLNYAQLLVLAGM